MHVQLFYFFRINLQIFSLYIIGRALVATYLTCTGVGWYLYLLNDKLIDNYQIESRSAILAITPLLDAEADRE